MVNTFVRRDFLAATGAGLTCSIFPSFGIAAPSEQFLKSFRTLVGGRTLSKSKVVLDIPKIAENGSQVLIGISVESPMTEESFVKTLHLLADENPTPEVATFHFAPQSGRAEINIQFRLANSQTVVAVAELNDGSLYMDSGYVRVTVGGCGGGN